MTSMYETINQLEITYGNEVEQLFSCSFTEYISRFVDIDKLVTLQDSDFTEDEIQDINISIEEARKSIEFQMELCNVDYSKRDEIIDIFYSSDRTYEEDLESRYSHIIYKLVEKFTGKHDELQRVSFQIHEHIYTDYFNRKGYSIELIDLFNRTTVNYSRGFVDMFIATMTLDLEKSVSERIVNEVLSEAKEQYEDIYDISSVMMYCEDIESLVSNISDLVLMYIFGNIATKDENTWPYNDILHTLQNKLKPYNMNINKYKKHLLLNNEIVDNIHINQLAIISILGEIVNRTLEEIDKKSQLSGNYDYAVDEYGYNIVSKLKPGEMKRLNIVALACIDKPGALSIAKDVNYFKQWMQNAHFGLCESIVDELKEQYGDTLYSK